MKEISCNRTSTTLSKDMDHSLPQFEEASSARNMGVETSAALSLRFGDGENSNGNGYYFSSSSSSSSSNSSISINSSRSSSISSCSTEHPVQNLKQKPYQNENEYHNLDQKDQKKDRSSVTHGNEKESGKTSLELPFNPSLLKL